MTLAAVGWGLARSSQSFLEWRNRGLSIFHLRKKTRYLVSYWSWCLRKPGCFFESWFSLDELGELFGLRLVVGKGAEETGTSGPDFLFVVLVGGSVNFGELEEIFHDLTGGVEFPLALSFGVARL